MTRSHQSLMTAFHGTLPFTNFFLSHLLQFTLMSFIFCSSLKNLFDFCLCIFYNLDCPLFFSFKQLNPIMEP